MKWFLSIYLLSILVSNKNYTAAFCPTTTSFTTHPRPITRQRRQRRRHDYFPSEFVQLQSQQRTSRIFFRRTTSTTNESNLQSKQGKKSSKQLLVVLHISKNEDNLEPTTSPFIESTTLYSDMYISPGDDAEECPEESCLLTILPETTKSSISTLEKNILNPILIIPLLSPILAYQTYDDIASLFNSIIDLLNYKRSWVPVDGGAYQARIIAPAINGIVVPAISILFATLISNTVATLRQRQIDIHTSLNTEAGDLRILSSFVDAFPYSTQRDKCREYLTQYTSRLIAESSRNFKINSVDFQGSTDSEMNGFVTTLNNLTVEGDDDENDESCNINRNGSRIPPDTILSESYGAVVRLNSQRSARITALQSTFPTLHYALLTALGGSICLAFLIETNQELLIFLNAIQLRILWTMLIGTFSALGVVCYDLSGPFRGQYQISNAVYQLMTIRDALRATCTTPNCSSKDEDDDNNDDDDLL